MLIAYCLKLSMALAVMYLFYFLLLRRLTFHVSNRWYLLLYPLVCAFICAIKVPVLIPEGAAQSPVSTFTQINASIQHTIAQPPAGYSFLTDTILYIYLSGIVFFACRFLIQLIALFTALSAATFVVRENGINIYHTDAKAAPFSFWRSVYINPVLLTEANFHQILSHEKAHARQLHTIDIICSEILVTLNWFNPFAWLTRSAIRQNLEFIADDQVVQTGCNLKHYQYLLVKKMTGHHFGLVNSFHFSSLKKRIVMMNTCKTGKVHYLRFALLLPLTAFCLLAFSTTTFQALPVQKFQNGISLHRYDKMDEDQARFFRKNTNVVLLHWKKGTTQLEVYEKGRLVQVIDLSDAADVQKAEKTFGKIPAPAAGPYTTLITDQKPVLISQKQPHGLRDTLIWVKAADRKNKSRKFAWPLYILEYKQ